jgi:predicted RND superfamily exporter protein
MYYLAYLIIQGILMGAAIDYSILFTSYFRDARKAQDLGQAIQTAFEGSSHSVLTSGLILTLVPIVMSFVMDDPMISSILKSLSIGALAAVIIILLLLPAVLAVLDPITTGRKSRNKQSTK